MRANSDFLLLHDVSNFVEIIIAERKLLSTVVSLIIYLYWPQNFFNHKRKKIREEAITEDDETAKTLLKFSSENCNTEDFFLQDKKATKKIDFYVFLHFL